VLLHRRASHLLRFGGKRELLRQLVFLLLQMPLIAFFDERTEP
jgi:hypothetical protein